VHFYIYTFFLITNNPSTTIFTMQEIR